MDILHDPVSLITIGVIVLIVILLVWIIVRINKVQQQMIYVNSEIERTTGREHRYWLRVKKRLYLSIIPFFGLFMRPGKKKKRRKNHSDASDV